MKATTVRSGLSAALLAAAGLALFLTGSEACTTRDCIGTLHDAPDGELVGPDTWESSPITGTWVHYGPQDALQVQIPAFANRTVVDTQVFLSPAPQPEDSVGDNYAEASGNLAEFQYVGTGPGAGDFVGEPVLGFRVLNGTCADYYARVLVVVAPLDADAGSADAGATDAAEADAGSDDASADAARE